LCVDFDLNRPFSRSKTAFNLQPDLNAHGQQQLKPPFSTAKTDD